MNPDPLKSFSVAFERVWIEILFYFGFIFLLWLSGHYFILFLWDSIVGGWGRKKTQTQNNCVEFTHLSGWPREKVLGKILITLNDELDNKSLSVLEHGSVYCVSLSPGKESQTPDYSESQALKSQTHLFGHTTSDCFQLPRKCQCPVFTSPAGAASKDLGLFIRKRLHQEWSFLQNAHWPFCTKTTPSIFALLQDESSLEDLEDLRIPGIRKA